MEKPVGLQSTNWQVAHRRNRIWFKGQAGFGFLVVITGVESRKHEYIDWNRVIVIGAILNYANTSDKPELLHFIDCTNRRVIKQKLLFGISSTGRSFLAIVVQTSIFWNKLSKSMMDGRSDAWDAHEPILTSARTQVFKMFAMSI